MKISSIALVAVVLSVSGGCQNDRRVSPEPAVQRAEVAGGYSEVDVSDPGVIRAAKFAVQARGDTMPGSRLGLHRIVSAQQQVVAGLNYRLVLELNENGSPRTAEATVWWQSWNTAEPYRLTAWSWK